MALAATDLAGALRSTLGIRPAVSPSSIASILGGNGTSILGGSGGGLPQAIDPSAITMQGTAAGLGPQTPVAPGGGTVSWAGQNLGTPTPFTPGTPISISQNTGNPLQTQGYGNYSIDPATGQYTQTSYVAPQASDANSLLDKIIQGSSQAALATMGGLAGASAAGLTGNATTLFGGANPLFGAASAPAAGDAAAIAPADTGASTGGLSSGTIGQGGAYIPDSTLSPVTSIDPATGGVVDVSGGTSGLGSSGLSSGIPDATGTVAGAAGGAPIGYTPAAGITGTGAVAPPFDTGGSNINPSDLANGSPTSPSSLLSNQNLINGLTKAIGALTTGASTSGGGAGALGPGAGNSGLSLGSGMPGLGSAGGMAGVATQPGKFNLSGPISYQGTNPMYLASALRNMLSQNGGY